MTKKIQTIGKAEAKLLHEESMAALASVAAKYGVTLNPARGSYDPEVGTFTFKAEFASADAERREFDLLVGAFYVYDGDGPGVHEGRNPFTKGDYGREFVANSQTYRLTGFNLRAPKFPIVATNVADGTTTRFTDKAVASILRQWATTSVAS